ncbi:MAG TPA: hypothetical protein VKV37_22785 [Ktedonobacteraceae bacterium]|jgi:hypothetical protein|nr:hypothetical protein [Ktedonobacteraceae bacterium]
MPENIRSHIVLAAITLILAVVVLGLLFVHPKPTIQYGPLPGSGGLVAPSHQQAYHASYPLLNFN